MRLKPELTEVFLKLTNNSLSVVDCIIWDEIFCGFT